MTGSYGTFLRSVAIVWVAALLAGVAAAQPDDRAQQLLQGVGSADAWTGETIDTMEMIVVVVLYEIDDTERRTRTLVDYVGRRALVESDLGAGLRSTLRVADGEVRMTVGDEDLPSLPGFAALYDALFDPPSWTFDPADLDATYDGVRAYGDLVEGEQVTVRGGLPIPGFEGLSDFDAGAPMAYLFDADGRVLAIVTETPGGTLLMMPDEPWGGGATPATSTYRLDPDGPVLTMRMWFEAIRINEPIPEGTF